MARCIEREFYPTLLKRYVRRITDSAVANYGPRIILFPDLSVWKHQKESLRRVVMNETLHYNGFLLTPPVSKFKQSLVSLIREKQGAFAVGNIMRVHVEPVTTVSNLADYAAKTLVAGRVASDWTVVLPTCRTEPVRTLNLGQRDREIREIQSRFNVSSEIAAKMLPNVVNVPQ
jgi:hypothetical protein